MYQLDVQFTPDLTFTPPPPLPHSPPPHPHCNTTNPSSINRALYVLRITTAGPPPRFLSPRTLRESIHRFKTPTITHPPSCLPSRITLSPRRRSTLASKYYPPQQAARRRCALSSCFRHVCQRHLCLHGANIIPVTRAARSTTTTRSPPPSSRRRRSPTA
jgi:hypothetical protein